MKKIAMAVHGGAGNQISYLKQHENENKAGLQEAIYAGYALLKKGKSAVHAVEAAVIKLEDNPLFNAGRGSALNVNGEVEMDASLMDGKTLKAGAVAIVRNIKNPIQLAYCIMTKTKHVFLSGNGAVSLAKLHHLQFESDDYFITEPQLTAYQEFCRKQKVKNTKRHGTVGAVAIDKNGNLAAATSTGGIDYCLPGRIGDSCVIGAGCYANNKTCAVSCTGEGEYIITRVIAHSIAMQIAFKKMNMQKACDTVVFQKPQVPHGDVGVIALDSKGNIGISFNTRALRRAYIDIDGKVHVELF